MTDKQIRIAVASLKGGAGKTTTTAYLAQAASAAGHTVMAADCDPQGSLTEWAEDAADEYGDPWGVPVIPAAAERMADIVNKLTGAASVVIADCPPTDGARHAIVRAVMGWADLVVSPMQPTGRDIGRVSATLDLADEAGTRAVVLVNRYHPGTIEEHEIGDALTDAEIPHFATAIPHRISIARELARPEALDVYGDLWAEVQTMAAAKAVA